MTFNFEGVNMDDNKNPFCEKEDSEDKNINNEDNKEVQKEETQAQEQEETNASDDEDKKDNYKEQYEDLNNKYLRLAADFDNFRKRTISEKEELSKYACAEVLKKLTVVLDTFDRAQEHLKEIEDSKVIKDSYDVIYNQLLDTLKKIGMEEIDCLGKPFNPNEHEAITQIPTDEFEPDSIASVVQKGYKIADRVIRPALVGVAKKKEDE